MECKFCGEELMPGAMYCSKCGKSQQEVGEGRKEDVICICPQCKAVVENEDSFCLKCGYAFGQGTVPKKRKYRFFILTGVIAVLILGIVIAFVYSEKQKQIERERQEQERIERELEEEREREKQRQELILSYEKKAEELHSAISLAISNFDAISSIFSAAANMQPDIMGPEFYTSYAEALCSTAISQERTRRITVDKIYSELSGIKCEEPETEELQRAMEGLYDAYVERYKLLIQHDFYSNSFNSKDSDTKKAFNESLEKSRGILNDLDVEKDNKDNKNKKDNKDNKDNKDSKDNKDNRDEKEDTGDTV